MTDARQTAARLGRGAVWLVGCEGMLGRRVRRRLEQQTARPLIATDRELDITDPVAVRALASTHCPAWIINCAAFTDVEGAEEQRQLAAALNAHGPRHLALAAAEIDATLLHVSTDYVFSGQDAPYREDDEARPVNAYGQTKLDGERAVVANCARYFIIRTAWLYDAHGDNFVRTMLRLFGQRDRLRVIDDQRGCPTACEDLASGLAALLDLEAPQRGIYHLTNRGATSWRGFAAEIYRGGRARGLVTRDVEIEPIASVDYPQKARRPPDTSLDCTRAARQLGIELAPWEAALTRTLDAIADERGRGNKGEARDEKNS